MWKIKNIKFTKKIFFFLNDSRYLIKNRIIRLIYFLFRKFPFRFFFLNTRSLCRSLPALEKFVFIFQITRRHRNELILEKQYPSVRSEHLPAVHFLSQAKRQTTPTADGVSRVYTFDRGSHLKCTNSLWWSSVEVNTYTTNAGEDKSFKKRTSR